MTEHTLPWYAFYMMKNQTTSTEIINHLRAQLPNKGLTLANGLYSLTVYIIDMGWVRITLNKEPHDHCFHLDAEVLPISDNESAEHHATYGLSYHKKLLEEKKPGDVLQEILDSIFFSTTSNI